MNSIKYNEDIDLPILFTKLTKNFNKDYGEFLRPYGLGKLHAFYLLCLYKSSTGLKLKDFNDILGCDKSNTSRAIADMQERDIICTNATDLAEKKYLVSLTEKGKVIAEKLSDLVKDTIYRKFEKITKDELDIFVNVVKKLLLAD